MEGSDIISMEENIVTECADTTEGLTLKSGLEFRFESVSDSDLAYVEDDTQKGVIEEVVVENESAQSTEIMIDYSETLTLIYTEIQTVNYLITVMVFLQLFIWVENKVNHIVRSVSNKWKV